MILNYITLKNIRNFRNLEKFPLRNQGIVLITGENGAGKTTFASAIRDILFGSMIDGTTNDDLVRNDKDALMVLSLEKDGNEYIIEKSRTKKKWKKTVTKNGVDITPHSQTNFYTTLTKELDFTKEEWDASVHLSQKGSHILVSGKPSNRKEYVSEFFGIDGDFDIIEEAAKAELDSVTKSIKDIEAYSTARATLYDELSQIEVKNIDEEILKRDKIKIEISESSKNVLQLKEKLRIYETYNQYKDSAYPSGYAEDVDVDYSLEHYRKLKADAESSLKNFNQIKIFNENVIRNNTQFDELSAIVEKDKAYDTQYTESIDNYQRELNSLNVKKGYLVERSKIQKSIESLLEYEKKEYYENIVDRETDLKTKNSLYAVLDNEYKRISSGKCPTCGHEHKVEDITSKYNDLISLYNEIKLLTDSLTVDKNTNSKIDELKKLKSRLAELPEFTPNDGLRLDELQTNIPKLRTYLNKKEQLSTMTRQEFASVQQPPTDKELNDINYGISFFLNISNARKLCPKPSEVNGIDGNNILSNINSLSSKISELEDEIRKIDAVIISENETRSRYDRISKQVKDIDEKFNTLGTLKEAEYFWKTMVQAYGPKGIRVSQLQKIMDLITNVLPMYTSIMFDASKSYEFFSTCDAGNIYIKVKRKDTEGEYEYDIASCSGGESKRIAICLVFAVAKIRLAKKKVNMVVLDEIDSQMDKYGRFQFTNELLPSIREQCDTIFIISHHSDTFQNSIYDKSLVFKPESEGSHYTKIVETNFKG